MKLLAIDLDGTTLTRKENITNKTMETLEKAYEQGVIIVPCTGRCLDCFPKQLQTASFFTYAISSNGARISNFKTRESIYKEDIPNALALEFLKQAPKIGITAHVDHGYKLQGFIPTLIGRLVRGKDTRKMETVKSLVSYLERNQKDVECMQLFLFGFHAYEKVVSILSSMDGISYTSTSGPSKLYMEMYSSHTSKGKALLYLTNHLGIEKKDIYCIGDGNNDLSMFEVAGFSMAVQNASNDLKQKANVIVPSNNQEGVAYAIEKYVLK